MRPSLLHRSLAVLALLALSGAALAQEHLFWAEDIALHVTPEQNVYGSNPNYIRWAGVNGATVYQNRTECSPFVTRVLKQAYGWGDRYFRRWLGSSSPSAAMYHDAILLQNRFTSVQHIADIRAGDIIAVKYPAGGSATGHVMFARGPAMARSPSAPLVADTVQYEVEVIDSSKSGHGADDTRLLADGGWDSGAGIGVLRLYADDGGTLTGYTWSTYSNSQYYGADSRHLVVGRLP